MEPRGVPEATGMRLERSVEPGVSGLSLLGAPRRVTQSPEFLSKLESGVGAGIAPEAGPRAAGLLLAGDTGDRQDRVQEGGPAPGKRTEGRGPFTPRTERSAVAGLTDTGQALVPGHRASRETYHPVVPRTEGASKNMGLPTLKLGSPGSTGMS